MAYIKTSDVFNGLQKNIMGGAKTPHGMSLPILRRTEEGYALAVFVFFFNAEEVGSGVLRRPAKWALADLETGEMIAEYNCSEHDFSSAPFEKLYNVSPMSITRPPISDYCEKEFGLLDKVRSELIETGKLNTADYDLYLNMITQKIPEEYQRFFFELGNMEEHNWKK
jgi:hypothetical protein